MSNITRRDALRGAAFGLAAVGVSAAAGIAQESKKKDDESQPERGGESSASSERGRPYKVEKVQEAKKDEIRALFKAPETAPESLAGSGFTYRHDWGNKHGQWTLRLNLSGVTPRSRVFVAIGEGAAGGPDGGKFIGGARYTVHNVAPRNGGVDIWINIEWSSDLRIYADYLVVNP